MQAGATEAKPHHSASTSESERPSREPSPSPKNLPPPAPSHNSFALKAVIGTICAIIAIISLLIEIGSIKPSRFCYSPSNLFCTPCPKHSICTEKAFDCKKGYRKSPARCYRSSISEGDILLLQRRLIEEISRNTSANFFDLVGRMQNYSKKELRNAILYDGDYAIYPSGQIVRMESSFASIAAPVVSIAAFSGLAFLLISAVRSKKNL